MQPHRYEVFVRPTARNAHSRNETVQQTANRLEHDVGRVEAIRIALDRMNVHRQRQYTAQDAIDAASEAARLDHNAKVSLRSYDRWRAVIVFLVPRLTRAERAQLGLSTRAHA